MWWSTRDSHVLVLPAPPILCCCGQVSGTVLVCRELLCAAGVDLTMADRKAEIDLKRKKLEELRKSREQKKSETANKAVRLPSTILCSMLPIIICLAAPNSRESFQPHQIPRPTFQGERRCK